MKERFRSHFQCAALYLILPWYSCEQLGKW
jgi:hypothetical protein